MKFIHLPAEDDTVDPEYRMLTNAMVETNIAIQDCRSYGGGYAVNEYAPEGTPAEDFWVRQIGTAQTLKKAKTIAEAYARKRGIGA